MPIIEALCYQAEANGGDSCPGGYPGLSWMTGSLAQLGRLQSHCLGAFPLRGSPVDLDFELLLCDLHEAYPLSLSFPTPLPTRGPSRLPCTTQLTHLFFFATHF